jgi:ABC-type Zn2+ transport system substrate-binding protein/surface adhesin
MVDMTFLKKISKNLEGVRTYMGKTERDLENLAFRRDTLLKFNNYHKTDEEEKEEEERRRARKRKREMEREREMERDRTHVHGSWCETLKSWYKLFWI